MGMTIRFHANVMSATSRHLYSPPFVAASVIAAAHRSTVQHTAAWSLHRVQHAETFRHGTRDASSFHSELAVVTNGSTENAGSVFGGPIYNDGNRGMVLILFVSTLL